MTTHNAAAPSAGRPRVGSEDPRPHVLVVEENLLPFNAASDMARRLGYRVTAASGMLAGLAAMRGTQFDLVLLELQMAGMGGAEGLKQLRLPGTGGPGFATPFDVPAIALTRPEQVTDGERLREAGFDDHLSRPFRASEMRAMLIKHLVPPAAVVPTAVLPVAPPAGPDARGAVETRDAHEAPGAGDVLDPQALARLAELDPKGESRLIERVLRAFQSAAARFVPQAEAARRSGDLKTLRLVAHTLKSSSASIGAMQLAQICATVETSIRLESAADLGPQLDAMDEALAAALRDISRRLGDAS